MKKLEKIRLQNAVVLENSEMKQVLGGSGGACDPFALKCQGVCYTIYGRGLCIRNSGTLLYCACVIP